MINIANYKISERISDDKKYQLEAEMGVFAGVKDVIINSRKDNIEIKFNAKKISKDKLKGKLIGLGLKLIDADLSKNENKENKIQGKIFTVKGMHCASCEILIENKLLKNPAIKSVEASAPKGSVVVEYIGKAPSIENLNNKFKNDGYIFNEEKNADLRSKKIENKSDMIINHRKLNNYFIVAGFSIIFIALFLFLNKSGLAALVSVNSATALPVFILFGLLAGFSSCSALVGGIILAMSKQWSDLYSTNNSIIKKFEPYLLFNAGRLISYGLLGALLGVIGSFFQISLTFTSYLVIIISVIMLFLGLQMLGVKRFQKFQFTMPKFITRYVADEKNFNGKYMPAIMGAATFILPCGFTITAQGLALISGSAIQAGLIMFFFALGTLPALLIIGLSSVKFTNQPHLADRFLKIAGIIVLFFAIFNINSQLNALGLKSLDDINFNKIQKTKALADGFPPIVDGKQIVKMDASSSGYSPNKLKVQAGIPVRWEITDRGTSGCTNAVISRGLFDGQIDLTPGKTSIKEFIPPKAGSYKFSCWMGMVSGIMDVVDANNNNAVQAAVDTNDKIISSGVKGCGCGGGGSGSCGG